MNDKTVHMNHEQAATFYRGVLAEAEDDEFREPDDLLAQAARGMRRREADRQFDAALGEGRR